MANLWFVTFILATWAVGAVNSTSRHQLGEPAMSPELEEAVAPTPVIDCSSLIYNMADCLSFLSDGSDETTPDNTCCSGFKLVMDTDADCICEALRSSSDLGIEINMTQVMTLPSACAFSAPFLSSCIVSMAPSSPPDATPVNPPPKNIAPPPEYQNPAPPEAQNPPPPPPPPEAESPPPASAPPPEAQNPPPPDSENPPAQVPSTSTSPAAKSPAPSPASSAGSSYTTHISFPVLFSMVVACLLYILV